MTARTPAPARPAGPREVVLRIVLPSVPTCTAMLGVGGVDAAQVCGTVPAAFSLVLPLVVLVLGSMAHYLGRHAVRRRDG